MRRRFLRAIAEYCFRFALPVGLVLILLTVMSISGVRRIRPDTGLADFLPPDSRDARLIGELMRDYRNLEPIVVEVRGKSGATPAMLIEVAEELTEVLDDPTLFFKSVYKLDALGQGYYQSLADARLMALLTEQDWTFVEELMEPRYMIPRLEMLRARRIAAFLPRRPEISGADPLGLLSQIRRRLSQARAPIPIHPWRGYFFSPDRETLQILAYPVHSSDDAREALRTTAHMEQSRDFVFDRRPEWAQLCEIAFHGSHVDTANTLRSMGRDLALIGGSSLIFVLLLLILTFRKAESIAFVLLPPTLGLFWALGLAHAFCSARGINTFEELGQTYTRVTGVTAVFLLITFGIGLSGSMHLYHRFVVELYRTRNYYRALRISYVETGRGVTASGLIAALIFFALYLTSFPGLKELGVLAGVATLCNLAACLLTVPALAAAKSALARGRVHPVALYRMNFSRLSDPALRAPRATLGAVLFASVFLSLELGPAGPRVLTLDFHPRFSTITAYLFRQGSTDESNRSWPGRPLVGIVEAETIQEALELNDRLYDALIALQRAEAGSEILAIDSLRVVLPSLNTQRSSLDRFKNLDLEPLRRSVDIATRQAGLQAAPFQSFVRSLADLQDQAVDIRLMEFSSPEGEDFNRAVTRFVTHKEGRYRVATPIFPSGEGFTPAQVEEIIRDASAATGSGSVRFVGDPVVERELSERIKYDLALFALLSSAFIFLALVAHFRRVRYALLAATPVLVTGLWVAGAMNIFGVEIHLLSLMGAPLIVVMSLNNSVHLLQNFIDRGSTDIRRSLRTLARSVILSCSALALMYGTLGLLGFEGLRDMGVVIVFGAAASLVCNLMLLPAMIQLWGRGEPLLAILAPPKSIDPS